MLIMLRPIADRIKGPSLSMVAAGPAMENISLPAAAIGLAPNTGEATNVAPLSPRRSEHLAHVSG